MFGTNIVNVHEVCNPGQVVSDPFHLVSDAGPNPEGGFIMNSK